ncbi:MAG: HEPN domain-containing protein [Leptospiraceae bacterium]|nr:HEPN domain-containing protein [Leptospiraceae bacterium]MCP5496387.1 HEPN domain-containing protein [Leptospiraceae bacterium]
MDDAELWLETAYEDLNAAEIMLNNQKYSHACFLSQQSTEKSIKALHIHLNGDPWGHSILKLLSELKQLDLEIYENFKDLEDSARIR